MQSTHATRTAIAVDPLDFLAVDRLLTDDERLIQATVRRFVRDRLLPEIDEWFECGVFPVEIARELGQPTRFTC